MDDLGVKTLGALTLQPRGVWWKVVPKMKAMVEISRFIASFCVLRKFVTLFWSDEVKWNLKKCRFWHEFKKSEFVNENGTLYSVKTFDYSQWSEFWWYQLQWLFCWRFVDRINLAVWFPIMVSIDWLTFGSVTWLIKLEYFVDHIKKCER